MRRRGMTLHEVMVYLTALALALPVIDAGARLALRRPDSLVATERGLRLERLCDRLRRDLAREGWSLEAGVLVIGAHRWQPTADGLLMDGDPEAPGAAVAFELDDQDWLRIRIAVPGSPERIVVAPPMVEGTTP